MVGAVIETNASPLLDWLLRKHPDTPKNRAKQWILAGRVSVNGVVIRKPHQPIADPGDTLELRGRHATTLACGSGWQIHPRVCCFIWIPPSRSSTRAPASSRCQPPNGDLSALSILADFLAGDLKARDRSVARKSLPPAYRRLQPLPVHRLDQYTSGVFCMATNPAARHHLIEQLKAHTMKREYVAFVDGRSSAPKGVWRQWLQLSRDELRQHIISETHARAAGDEAREAITHYEVIAEYPRRGRHAIRHQAAAAAGNRPEASDSGPGCERRAPLAGRPHLQPGSSRQGRRRHAH